MKKLILLIAFGCFLSTLQAQSKTLGPFLVKKIDVVAGTERDMLNDMGADYFMNQIDDPNFSLANRELDDQDIISGVCENPHWRFGMTLVAPGKKGLEWRNAIVWMPNRIDAVTYRATESTTSGDFWGNNGGDYINFSQTQSEIALESGLSLNLIHIGPFNLYGGFGSNAGFTYDNSIYVHGSNQVREDIDAGNARDIFEGSVSDGHFSERYETKTNFNHRVFLQGGASVVLFRRVELGMELRRGVGYRVVGGAPTAFTNLMSAGFSARLLLK